MNKIKMVNLTHNQFGAQKRNGTSFRGAVIMPYDRLVEMFGKPIVGSPDGKVQAQWHILLDGVFVTIYDYKERVAAKNVTDWHIGGHEDAAYRLFEQYREEV